MTPPFIFATYSALERARSASRKCAPGEVPDRSSCFAITSAVRLDGNAAHSRMTRSEKSRVRSFRSFMFLNQKAEGRKQKAENASRASPHFPSPFVDERKQRLLSDRSCRSFISAFCFLPSAFHSPHFPSPFVDERKQRLLSGRSCRSFISAFCFLPSAFHSPHFPPPFVDERKQRLLSDSCRSFIS